MGFPKAVAGHIRANPEIGHRGNAVADRGAVKLENSLTPDRNKDGVVERCTNGDVSALD